MKKTKSLHTYDEYYFFMDFFQSGALKTQKIVNKKFAVLVDNFYYSN